MQKKIVFSLIAVIAVIGGVAGMAAYEAHVINVTAHIENALSVDTTPIEFGTVFPQEYLEKLLTISLSSSFLEEDRVDDVEYVIKQKPKPLGDPYEILTLSDGSEVVAHEFCLSYPEEHVDYYRFCYLSLCPFLSKTDGDPDDRNDQSHFSYYNDPTPNEPNSGDEYCENPGLDAAGRLAKSEQDISDVWVIDLKVPPVDGFVGQDWPFGCPVIDEDSQDYGCDLWIEVTDISLPENGICEEKPDVMLVLDRSGSISSGELTTMQTAAYAFVTALNPSADGAHMGQTSFADTGSLDLHLTGDKVAIDGAIGGLTTGGATNLYEGIDLANTELGGGDGHDRNDTESPDFMVIITDGAPNRPLGSDPAALAAAAAAAAKNAGVTIYVVGVGTTVDTANYLRNNIASSPAHYFDVTDFTQLRAILEALASCPPTAEELACTNSGGTVTTSMCCLATSDFPNTCSIGACGCAPEDSHEVKVCECPTGYCFNGGECVLENG